MNSSRRILLLTLLAIGLGGFSFMVHAPMTVKDFIARNSLVITLCLALGAAVVALSVIMRYRSQTRHQMYERLYVDMYERLYVDPLTGRWTGQWFRVEAEKFFQSDPAGPCAIVYLDIREFKYINDAHGYDQGDRVLRAVSEHLAENLTPGEMFARLEADHFVLLLPGDQISGEARVHSLWRGLKDISWMSHYSMSFNAGLYQRQPGETDLTSMLERANYARSMAKRTRPNLVMSYNESFRESIRREKEVEAIMRMSLLQGEFVPYFQPKMDMVTGRMVGAEALVRWVRPGQGIVPPDQFIPLFEKNGFIVDLDFYIYEQVCAYLSQWLIAASPVVPIACNISRLHIGDRHFCDRLEGIAVRYDVPPRYLELEITESVAAANIDLLVALMRRLQKHGFSIAIDDFGAGYSSLGLLQRLPADTLKLDHSFVDAIAQRTDAQRTDLVIVEGVINIAHKLQMKVVCEGVETREQAEVLQSVNCRLVQGYYYSQPLSAGDFARYMMAFAERPEHPPGRRAPAESVLPPRPSAAPSPPSAVAVQLRAKTSTGGPA